MAELLLLADAEGAAIRELDDQLPGADEADIPVVGTIPDPRPAEFIRVIASGGTTRDMVTGRHSITIEGWSERKLRAHHLVALGIAIIERAGRRGLLGGLVCHEPEALALPQNLPYPNVDDRFRYVATISVDLRKSTV